MPILSLGILCLVFALLWALRRFRGTDRGYLEINPQYAAWMRSLGLTRLDRFYALSGVIVGGHPDRHVRRVALGQGESTTIGFLKQEHSVPWRVRWSSWWAGLGWSSRSLREARVLQALEREGFPAPTWVAVGESPDGRAFLLLLELPNARELRAVLPSLSLSQRARHLVNLGRLLARLHTCGLVHPDLYSGHVLVQGDGDQLVFIDWARCRRQAIVTPADRARALAALDVTVPPEEVSGRERLLVLRAYLRTAEPEVSSASHSRFASLLDGYRDQLAQRRHIIEKRQPRCLERPQTWQPIDGSRLEISSHLADLFSGDPRSLLPTDGEPSRSRWLATDNGYPLRLVRNRHRGILLKRLLAWVCGRTVTTPEQQQAHLLLRLERYRIAAPQVLAKGQLPRGLDTLESFILYRPLPGHLGIHHWLRRCSDPELRRRVLHQAGEVVRGLHDAGCYLGSADSCHQLSVQNRNQDPRVGLAEIQGFQVCRRLKPHQASSDLALCQTVLDRHGIAPQEWDAFLEGYAGMTANVSLPSAEISSTSVEGALSGPTATTLTTQTPRTGLWQRIRKGVTRWWHQTRWPRFMGGDWLASIMSRPVTDNFHAKQGRSTGRMILEPDSGTEEPLRIYLKRHYQLPWWDALRALLWPGGAWSPAVQEMHHLEKARRLGVPVPEVVAAGEFIGPGLRLQSFLAVRELTGMLPLNLAIPLAGERLSPEQFAQWKRGLIRELARLCRLLHDRNWFHKDLYLCHFYIPESFTWEAPPDWRNEIYLIDLHRLSHHPWTWAIWQMKDLAQLLYSSEIHSVTDRDRLAFWRAYQGSAPRTGWDRWLRWAVVLKWKRYRAHNLKSANRRKSTPPPQEN